MADEFDEINELLGEASADSNSGHSVSEADFDGLNALFSSASVGAPDASTFESRSASRGMSWEEWAWRAMDKQLDALRRKNGLKPYNSGYRKREADLEKYLESCKKNQIAP